MLNVKRTIQPIGQGAFYTETLSHFDSTDATINVIYDCGSFWDNKKKKITPQFQTIIGNFVSNSNFQNSQENLIFISHFHLDHINGVKHLLDEIQKRYPHQAAKTRLILPFINDEMKLYFLTSNIITLFEDSTPLFDDELVIWLRNFYFNDDQENFPKIHITDEGDLRTFQYTKGVLSNTNSKDFDWIYIPIIYKSKELIKTTHLFIKKLFIYFKLNDFSELLDIFKGQSLADNWDHIKDLYSMVSDSQKENNLSLMLFSGTPKDSDFEIRQWKIEPYICFCDMNKPSCLYVGDMGDKKAIHTIPQIDKIIPGLTKTIGTIQISHHGAKNSFNSELAKLQPIFAFCCHGSLRPYKHPNPTTLGQFSIAKSIAISIDEKDNSFCQVIHVW